MLKLILTFLLLIYSAIGYAASLNDEGEGVLMQKTSPISYHMQVTINLKNTGFDLTKLVAILPLPQENPYQIISNAIYSGASMHEIPGTSDRYIRCLYVGVDVPHVGESKSCKLEFDVTLFQISTDFSKIKDLVPYQKDSELYKAYTGKSGSLIDPNNPIILSISHDIWAKSKNVLDYAKRCYEYVAKNYKYLNPNTGLHPLTKLLVDSGGDCGNLSNIYISLLRAQGIPARPLVALRPDGSSHVWADFYLQNYGWIPVDVTYKNSDPQGDYFGKVGIKRTGIILTKNVNLPLDAGDTIKNLRLLQSFAYWYWYNGKSGQIERTFTFRETNIR